MIHPNFEFYDDEDEWDCLLDDSDLLGVFDLNQLNYYFKQEFRKIGIELITDII